MHLACSLWAVAVLCLPVRGRLTNFTLDDTSPVISYNPAPVMQCSPSTCPEPLPPLVPPYNGTSTLVESGVISIPFVGTAVYVYLSVEGACSFNLDGRIIGDAVNHDPISLAFYNDSLSDTAHILTISVVEPKGSIVLDYVVFSHNVRTSRGAIIGGVIGGVATAAILSIAGLLLRRRQKRKQLSTRGIPLGDHWPDKPSIQLMAMRKGEQK
ncbi:hypothetical protein MSAN_02125800 [Mycena sanguinolenta]|uniref:Uncharacterized protein n=1 Tax=Mycena sanguinolenta TaxID=230812 RepID=A0A8H7CMA6_9AGAR|nr:hypothetical protein MSAN_02125800 [Mycena sanguinolenta]